MSLRPAGKHPGRNKYTCAIIIIYGENRNLYKYRT